MQTILIALFLCSAGATLATIAHVWRTAAPAQERTAVASPTWLVETNAGYRQITQGPHGLVYGLVYGPAEAPVTVRRAGLTTRQNLGTAAQGPAARKAVR